MSVHDFAFHDAMRLGKMRKELGLPIQKSPSQTPQKFVLFLIVKLEKRKSVFFIITHFITFIINYNIHKLGLYLLLSSIIITFIIIKLYYYSLSHLLMLNFIITINNNNYTKSMP